MRQNRMPKQHFALISRRILALHWHALSGSQYRVVPAVFILICQQMSRRDDGKDEALTTIVKVENPSPALLPCPKSVTSAISLLAKAERPLIILGGAAHNLMNSFVNLLKVPRFHSCQCLWRKGSSKIRIHFLRQLRVRLPRQMLTLSCLLVHD